MRVPFRVNRSRLLMVAILAVAFASLPLGVIASHGFTDVPDSNTFHDDIDAIAAAGITTGCGPGKYCPKDPVTREQMAAFMNRLGALGPDKTPVVNADELDGQDATAFASAGHDHDAAYLAADGKAADADLLDGLDSGAFAGVVHGHGDQYLAADGKAADADKLDGQDSTAFAVAGHDHDAAYLAIDGKAADANLLDGQDSAAFAVAGHDHDAAYLAIDGKAADANLLDGVDGSSYTRGIKATRLGGEIDLTTTATTVATLALPVSSSHSTFFVFFTAQIMTSGGPITCDLVGDDDGVFHSRTAGSYGPNTDYADLSLNYPVWIVDSPNVRVDCRKLEPTALISKISTRELQALALGSGP